MGIIRCKRCKRKLSNLKSIEIGYGATCAKKAGIAIPRKVRKKKRKKENYKSLEAWSDE